MCKVIKSRPRINLTIICGHIETIKSLSAVYTKSRLTLDCMDSLNEISKNRDINLQIRNPNTPYPTPEEITVTDTQMEGNTLESNVGTSYKDITEHIEEWTIQNHISHFISHQNGKA